jgi:hypothetical protein
MTSSIKKVCINSSKHYYTGTELSPLHFGLSAEGYELNSVMEGYDKELWVVDIKNNKKVWVKNEAIIRITREDPIINNIEPRQSENKINEKIVNIMNSNKAIIDNERNNLNETHKAKDNTNNISRVSDNLNILDKKKSTDYNIFVKYRLNQLKDISKNKKENFNNTKNEWHDLKKDKEKFKITINNAKIWYLETLKTTEESSV